MDKLTLMHSFVAVVEQGNYTKAAVSLGKTKAIISRQVSQLETLLGVKLINRTTRSIAITDTGRSTYQSVRKILDDVSALAHHAAIERESISGRIRISAPQSFTEIKLIGLLAIFMQRYPNIEVDLQLQDRYVDIVNEGFDLAIRIGQLQDSSLIARPIGSIDLKLVASPKLLERLGEINTPADLQNCPVVLDSNNRLGSKWLLIKDGQKNWIQPVASLSVNSAVAAKKAVLAGLGISLLPDFAVAQELEQQTLVCLLQEYSKQNIGIYALYPHRQHLSEKVRVLVDFLQECQ